jgi:uncharacterized protein (TIGR03083 family)
VDHAAYVDVVADESARFLAAVRRGPLDRIVPSTPAWTVADLAWHVAEVQWFWAAIVTDLREDVEDLEEPTRPDDGQLLRAVTRGTEDLVAALRAADPTAACWSWFEGGHTVGWVARRQAHEALIHRVDAELAVATPVVAAPPALAADGIDELFDVMLRAPSWGRFEAEPTAVRVATTDTGDTWTMRFGRFTGTSPHTGTIYDDEVVRLDGAVADDEVVATVRGTAWDLDRWLWGRGPSDPLRREGDVASVHRLRSLAEVE